MCHKLAYIAHTTHPHPPACMLTPAQQCTITRFFVDIAIPDMVKQEGMGDEGRRRGWEMVDGGRGRGWEMEGGGGGGRW